MRRLSAAGYVLITVMALAAASRPGDVLAARGTPPPTDTEDQDQLFEWSPLVRDIQVFLIEFGLYSGPADGRLTSEVRDAIRTYQRKHDLPDDGEASQALLKHMGSVGRPASLKHRLEEARRKQMERARKALTANPETRDLLNDTTPATAPQGAPRPEQCVKSPSADCLIDIALAATDAIDRNDYRDWALREVVQAQARSGKLVALRESIRRISDVRLILVSLREAVKGLVDAHRVADAKALALTIPDDWNQARALAAVAIAEAGRPSLQDTLPTLRLLLTRLEDKVAASEIAAHVAVELSSHGSATEAVALLDLARRFARPPTDPDTGHALLTVLAGAYARIGRTDEALAILKSVGDIGRDHIALAEAAGRIAQKDLSADALALADKLRAPRLHVLALSKIAAAQSHLGEQAAARQTLQHAMNASLDIARPFAADTAAAEIAAVWATLPDYKQAFATIDRIKSHALRAQTLWQLAARASTDNTELSNRASAATDEIDSAFDRAAVLTQAATEMAKHNRPEEARALFEEALHNARTVRTSWWRARIFSRLAGTLQNL